MARIRTIKPDFWADVKVGECSPTARLLLLAALNFADDYGNLDRSARQIKAQAFPYDDIDCEPLIAELLGVGLVIEYKISNKLYLHIKNFQKHQRIEKPSLPRFPLYDDSARTTRGLPDSSPTPPRAVTVLREGKGRDMEWKGEEKEGMQGETRAARSTAARLPEDWQLTKDRQAIAEQEGADAARTFANFTDYWKAAGGQKARKHDWDAAWRIWCRREGDTRQKPRKTRYEEIVEPLEARIRNG